MINQFAIEALKRQYKLPVEQSELLDICFTNPHTLGLDRSAEGIKKQNAWNNLHFIGSYVLKLCISSFVFFNYSLDPNTQSVCASKVKKNYADAFFQNNPLVMECALLANPEDSYGEDANQKLMYTFLAYIYLTFGYDAVYCVIEKDLLTSMPAVIEYPELVDPKTALQEMTQGLLHLYPEYTVIGQEGLDHQKTFTVCVRAGKYVTSSKGASKKDAEKQAATAMLYEHFEPQLKRMRRQISPNPYTLTYVKPLPPSKIKCISKWFMTSSTVINECLISKALSNEIRPRPVRSCEYYVSLGMACYAMSILDALFYNQNALYEKLSIQDIIAQHSLTQGFSNRFKTVMDDLTLAFGYSAGESRNEQLASIAQREELKALLAADYVIHRIEGIPISRILNTHTSSMQEYFISLSANSTNSETSKVFSTSIFQEIIQATGWNCSFSDAVMSGQDHKATFTMSCILMLPAKPPISFSEKATSKKEARRILSDSVICYLQSLLKQDGSFAKSVMERLFSPEVKGPSKAIIIQHLIKPAGLDPFLFTENPARLMLLLRLHTKNNLPISAAQIERCLTATKTPADVARLDDFFREYPEYVPAKVK